MANGGSALGRTAAGQVAFIDDALPGETVDAEVFSSRSRYLRGRAVEVTTPAPGRVAPPCPYVPACGGCQLQHASYEAQFALKLHVLAETLRRGGATAPEPDPIPADNPFRYRIRGEFHLVPGGGAAPGLGFTRRRSWDLVAVEDCLIHHDNLTEALPGVRRALGELKPGTLRTLHLTCLPDARELLWQARGGTAPDGLQAALAEALPGYLVHQDDLTLTYRGARLDGRAGDLIFRVDSDTFVQVNHDQAHRLYGRALEYIGDRPGRLVEGYAGFGALSVMAATRSEPAARPTSLVLVEEARAAVVLGRLHLRLHEVAAPWDWLRSTVEEALPGFEPGEVDSLVLDPPRAGLGAAVVTRDLPHPARAAGVLSCDPATLARDLAQLAGGGYAVEAQSMVDMFPQTYHIETASLLRPVRI